MAYDDGKAPTELKRRNKDILDPCLNIHYCLCACNLLPLIIGPWLFVSCDWISRTPTHEKLGEMAVYNSK